MTISLEAIQTAGMWALIAIGVIGIVLAIIIKKVIGKIIALVLAAVLIMIGWQQRQHVLNYANAVKGAACAQSATFLGIDVSLPDSWCEPG